MGHNDTRLLTGGGEFDGKIAGSSIGGPSDNFTVADADGGLFAVLNIGMNDEGLCVRGSSQKAEKEKGGGKVISEDHANSAMRDRGLRYMKSEQ